MFWLRSLRSQGVRTLCASLAGLHPGFVDPVCESQRFGSGLHLSPSQDTSLRPLSSLLLGKAVSGARCQTCASCMGSLFSALFRLAGQALVSSAGRPTSLSPIPRVGCAFHAFPPPALVTVVLQRVATVGSLSVSLSLLLALALRCFAHAFAIRRGGRTRCPSRGSGTCFTRSRPRCWFLRCSRRWRRAALRRSFLVPWLVALLAGHPEQETSVIRLEGVALESGYLSLVGWPLSGLPSARRAFRRRLPSWRPMADVLRPWAFMIDDCDSMENGVRLARLVQVRHL